MSAKNGKKTNWSVPVVSALLVIVCAAAYVLFKMGQGCAEDKWKDYDDCGWS